MIEIKIKTVSDANTVDEVRRVFVLRYRDEPQSDALGIAIADMVKSSGVARELAALATAVADIEIQNDWMGVFADNFTNAAKSYLEAVERFDTTHELPPKN